MTFNINGKMYMLNMDGLLFAIIILSAFLILALLISLMRIYKKAGKPAISAIIPIWNVINWLQIIEKPIWYIFLFLIPFVNIYVMFVMYIGLAKKFGKGTGFGILMIFFPWIMIPLLSFSDYQGESPKKEEEPIYNPFNQTEVQQVMPSAPLDNNAPTVVAPVEINTETSSNEATSEPVIEPVENMVEEVPANTETQPETGTDVSSATPSEPLPEVPIETEVASNENEVISPEEPSVPEVEAPTEPISPDMTIDNKPILSEEPVEKVEEPKIVEEENTPVIPEISVNEGIINEAPAPIVEESNTLSDNSQDIQNLTKNLYENKPVNVKDIAFGNANTSTTTLENPSNETPTTENPETLVDIESVNEEPIANTETQPENENIELPEKATKTCPACGVSLAEDTKFCVACGTQL